MTRLVQACAAGCGQNTTVLPAEIIAMPLLITVAVGLVLGVIEQMTPHGPPAMTCRPLSPRMTVGCSDSGPGVPLATASFFVFLSAARPMPVSSRACRPQASACASAVARITATTCSRSATPPSRSLTKASSAAASASSGVAKMPLVAL